MNLEFTPQDMWKATYDHKKANYLGEYHPKSFWEEWGKYYLETFTSPQNKDGKSTLLENRLLLNLHELLARIQRLEPESVLEVGCGFGRCLPFVLDNVPSIKRLVGIEFASTMFKSAEPYLKAYYRGDEIKLIQGDASNLPFKDNEFDLIYTHVCLTHIPPGRIPRVTSEIARVARKWIIHIERFNFLFEHPNQHRWSHCLPPFYLSKKWDLHEGEALTKKPDHHTKIYVFKNRAVK